MNRPPSVVHFRCLDTMGLRGVARAIGAGRAGVRLTPGGLAIYRRGARRGPPPLPPSEVAIERALPLVAGPASFEFAREPAGEDAPVEEPRETLAPCVAASRSEASPEPTLGEAEPVLIELGLRRPTIWAVAFLTLGITFGAAIARVVTAAAPASAASAGVVVVEGAPAPVAWPRATRSEVAPPTSMPEQTIIAPTLPSPPPLGADPAADSAHASIAPTRALHSSHHHRAQATARAEDTAAPAAPEHEATDSENAEAAVARAREALTDAL